LIIGGDQPGSGNGGRGLGHHEGNMGGDGGVHHGDEGNDHEGIGGVYGGIPQNKFVVGGVFPPVLTLSVPVTMPGIGVAPSLTVTWNLKVLFASEFCGTHVMVAVPEPLASVTGDTTVGELAGVPEVALTLTFNSLVPTSGSSTVISRVNVWVTLTFVAVSNPAVIDGFLFG